jgi:hypothetical protein
MNADTFRLHKLYAAPAPTHRGVPCPDCNGDGETTANPSGAPWDERSVFCWTCDGHGVIVVPRSTTRAQWKRRRELAHDAEASAGLLRNDRQFGPNEAASAARLRAEATVPADPTEAERNARWFRLQAALIAARPACSVLRGARQLARLAA